ncbi:hypothetical protein [Rhodoligotrophos defluvii]|uniref:hypothetical protein n=1 Tax=Rhodoligotrophos defluvii TaxID=2561934 RepID=UPI0010C992F3|nr:hypothetical protein [Rhodoligotrophos defluvii]
MSASAALTEINNSDPHFRIDPLVLGARLAMGTARISNVFATRDGFFLDQAALLFSRTRPEDISMDPQSPRRLSALRKSFFEALAREWQKAEMFKAESGQEGEPRPSFNGLTLVHASGKTVEALASDPSVLQVAGLDKLSEAERTQLVAEWFDEHGLDRHYTIGTLEFSLASVLRQRAMRRQEPVPDGLENSQKLREAFEAELERCQEAPQGSDDLQLMAGAHFAWSSGMRIGSADGKAIAKQALSTFREHWTSSFGEPPKGGCHENHGLEREPPARMTTAQMMETTIQIIDPKAQMLLSLGKTVREDPISLVPIIGPARQIIDGGRKDDAGQIWIGSLLLAADCVGIGTVLKLGLKYGKAGLAAVGRLFAKEVFSETIEKVADREIPMSELKPPDEWLARVGERARAAAEPSAIALWPASAVSSDVPARFRNVGPGEIKTYTHPLTGETLTVTRIKSTDQVVALRGVPGRRNEFQEIDWVSGEANPAREMQAYHRDRETGLFEKAGRLRGGGQCCSDLADRSGLGEFDDLLPFPQRLSELIEEAQLPIIIDQALTPDAYRYDFAGLYRLPKNGLAAIDMDVASEPIVLNGPTQQILEEQGRLTKGDALGRAHLFEGRYWTVFPNSDTAKIATRLWNAKYGKYAFGRAQAHDLGEGAYAMSTPPIPVHEGLARNCNLPQGYYAPAPALEPRAPAFNDVALSPPPEQGDIADRAVVSTGGLPVQENVYWYGNSYYTFQTGPTLIERVGNALDFARRWNGLYARTTGSEAVVKFFWNDGSVAVLTRPVTEEALVHLLTPDAAEPELIVLAETESEAAGARVTAGAAAGSGEHRPNTLVTTQAEVHHDAESPSPGTSPAPLPGPREGDIEALLPGSGPLTVAEQTFHPQFGLVLKTRLQDAGREIAWAGMPGSPGAFRAIDLETGEAISPKIYDKIHDPAQNVDVLVPRSGLKGGGPLLTKPDRDTPAVEYGLLDEDSSSASEDSRPPSPHGRSWAEHKCKWLIRDPDGYIIKGARLAWQELPEGMPEKFAQLPRGKTWPFYSSRHYDVLLDVYRFKDSGRFVLLRRETDGRELFHRKHLDWVEGDRFQALDWRTEQAIPGEVYRARRVPGKKLLAKHHPLELVREPGASSPSPASEPGTSRAFDVAPDAEAAHERKYIWELMDKNGKVVRAAVKTQAPPEGMPAPFVGMRPGEWRLLDPRDLDGPEVHRFHDSGEYVLLTRLERTLFSFQKLDWRTGRPVPNQIYTMVDAFGEDDAGPGRFRSKLIPLTQPDPQLLPESGSEPAAAPLKPREVGGEHGEHGMPITPLEKGPTLMTLKTQGTYLGQERYGPAYEWEGSKISVLPEWYDWERAARFVTTFSDRPGSAQSAVPRALDLGNGRVGIRWEQPGSKASTIVPDGETAQAQAAAAVQGVAEDGDLVECVTGGDCGARYFWLHEA